ncbi:hypothetical protein DRO33_00210, partial [Candidatus Bathyarchaeota archaeon]
QKLPSQLQLQFYELAEREARQQAKLLGRLREQLEGLVGHLAGLFKQVPNEDWEDLRVAVVDGSYSPMLEARLLGRYGVYCAGYHVYEGAELAQEPVFTSGVVFRPNEEQGRVSRVVIGLLTALRERRLALRCVEELGVDYVMVDGSFFGFVWGCVLLRDVENERRPVVRRPFLASDIEGFRSPSELVDALTEATLELLKTGRAIGVVKRVRLRAIDGWLLRRHAREVEEAPDYTVCMERASSIMTGAIDKAVLSMLMPPGTWFSYSDLLSGEPAWAYHYYSRLASRYLPEVKLRKEPMPVEGLLEHYKDHDKKRLLYAFGQEAADFITKQLERHYIKAFEEAPACCLEVPRNTKLGPILAYCAGFASEDTGHPFPLDLIDDDVTLPRLFTREFVQEVEARLLEGTADLEAVRRLFTYLNPQKKWRA